MDDVTFPILIRSLLIVTTFTVMVGFVVHTWRRRDEHALHERFLYVGAVFLIGANGIRSIEAMHDGDPLKWALVPYMVGLLCFIAYLTYPRPVSDTGSSRR
jgi:hypothetical protein